jgi:hypothetical protein
MEYTIGRVQEQMEEVQQTVVPIKQYPERGHVGLQMEQVYQVNQQQIYVQQAQHHLSVEADHERGRVMVVMEVAMLVVLLVKQTIHGKIIRVQQIPRRSHVQRNQ